MRGHVLRKQTSEIPRVELEWTPPGKRNSGQPMERWQMSVEREMKDKGWTWGMAQEMSADRQNGRSSAKASCAIGTKRTK